MTQFLPRSRTALVPERFASPAVFRWIGFGLSGRGARWQCAWILAGLTACGDGGDTMRVATPTATPNPTPTATALPTQDPAELEYGICYEQLDCDPLPYATGTSRAFCCRLGGRKTWCAHDDVDPATKRCTRCVHPCEGGRLPTPGPHSARGA